MELTHNEKKKKKAPKTTSWFSFESRLQLKMRTLFFKKKKRSEINGARLRPKDDEADLLLRQSSTYKQQPSRNTSNPAHSAADLHFYITRSQRCSARAFHPSAACRCQRSCELRWFNSWQQLSPVCPKQASNSNWPLPSQVLTDASGLKSVIV